MVGWAAARCHDADGEVVFGIGITTDPRRERQRGIAQALLDGALAIAQRSGEGAARMFLA